MWRHSIEVRQLLILPAYLPKSIQKRLHDALLQHQADYADTCLKRDGVPPTPRTADTDAAPSRKDTTNTTSLLAEPSAEMIGAAEQAEISGRQLTTAKNNLERNRVRKEETEIEAFLCGEREASPGTRGGRTSRYEEQLETNSRKREKEAALNSVRNSLVSGSNTDSGKNRGTRRAR